MNSALAAYTTSARRATTLKPKRSASADKAKEKARQALLALRARIGSRRFVLGIDPGVACGFALWDRKARCFICVDTLALHDAIIALYRYCTELNLRDHLYVRVEDARLRKWFGDNAQAKLMGAGSIRRECSIWEGLLKDMGVAYEMVHPVRGGTKWDEDRWKRVTGWKRQTSHHARDASLLVLHL